MEIFEGIFHIARKLEQHDKEFFEWRTNRAIPIVWDTDDKREQWIRYKLAELEIKRGS
jgi:hypothetical protein